MWTLVRIAARNLFRHRRRSAIAVVALVMGVTAVLAIRGLVNGVQRAFRDETIAAGVSHLSIHKAGYLRRSTAQPIDMDIPGDAAFLEKIRQVPHVAAVAPRIAFGGMVSSGDLTSFAIISAVDPVAERLVSPGRKNHLSQGRLFDERDRDGAAIAGELQRRLQLDQGGLAAVLAGDRDGVLNAVDIHLTGAIGLPNVQGLESKVGLIPFALGQELLRMPGRATEIGIAVDDLSNLEAARDGVSAVVGPGYDVDRWSDVAIAVAEETRTQNAIFGVVTGIFVFIALLGIANVMTMSVLERTREIGTMMALGVRRQTILGLFLAEAVIIAVVGASLGSAVGITLVHFAELHGMDFHGVGGGIIHVAPTLDLSYFVKSVIICSIGAGIAGLWPAWKASRLRPVEALGTP